MTEAAPGDKKLERSQFDLQEFVRRVLAEDMGSGGDVTSDATIDADARFDAVMNSARSIAKSGSKRKSETATACPPALS